MNYEYIKDLHFANISSGISDGYLCNWKVVPQRKHKVCSFYNNL